MSKHNSIDLYPRTNGASREDEVTGRTQLLQSLARDSSWDCLAAAFFAIFHLPHVEMKVRSKSVRSKTASGGIAWDESEGEARSGDK